MRRIVPLIALVLLLISAVFVLGQGTPTPVYDPGLRIMVDNQSCDLTLRTDASATPEVTAEATVESAPDYPVLMLGDDCYTVEPMLYLPSNGTLWVALSLPNEPEWQHFRAPEDDPVSAALRQARALRRLRHRRTGRSGLLHSLGQPRHHLSDPASGLGGQSLPRAEWAARPPPPSISATAPVSTPNSGVWGDCGSCTTCGGPVEHCVLSPDNQCLWDAARCENPTHAPG